MLVFEVLGYILKLNYPLAPLVLAIVLGNKAEGSFRQALLGSQGRVSTVFWSNWLVGSDLLLGLIALFWPLISAGLSRLRPAYRVMGTVIGAAVLA